MVGQAGLGECGRGAGIGFTLGLSLALGGGVWARCCQGLGLAVGGGVGLPGSCVSGRSLCRVAAFGVSGLLELAIFFITISHCAWRRVISDMTFRVNRCF